MLRIACLGIAALLTACATSTQIIGPNGTPLHAIRCGAAAPDVCLAKAGELCPNGYVVVSSQGSRYLGQLTTGGVFGSGGNISGSATSVPMLSPNSLVVECKAPK